MILFFGIALFLTSAKIVIDLKEKRSDKYLLAQQMLREECMDTIDIQKYMNYENITFVRGRQYQYGSEPKDSVVRNYVCPTTKRTYSVDFMLDVYQNRKTFKETIVDIVDDIELLLGNDQKTDSQL